MEKRSCAGWRSNRRRDRAQHHAPTGAQTSAPTCARNEGVTAPRCTDTRATCTPPKSRQLDLGKLTRGLEAELRGSPPLRRPLRSEARSSSQFEGSSQTASKGSPPPASHREPMIKKEIQPRKWCRTSALRRIRRAEAKKDQCPPAVSPPPWAKAPPNEIPETGL